MAKQVISIVLAFNLLVATTGIGLFYHYCSQEGVLVSLFTPIQCICAESGDTETCTEEKACCAADSSELIGSHINNGNCCSEDFELLKNDIENLNPTAVEYTPPTWDGLNPYFNLLSQGEISVNEKILRFYSYKAPPLIIDRHLVFSSFLC